MFDNFDMSAPLSEKLSFGLQVGGFGILVVFLLLIILAVCIIILSRVIRLGEDITAKKITDEEQIPAATSVPAATVAPAGTPLPATQSTGSLDLTDIDEPSAAVIMAIVSKESGVPLNRLLFKSIKKVD